MTQGMRLRLVMAFTLIATAIGIGITAFAYQRSMVLQSLRRHADSTLQSMYFLSNTAYNLLYTANDIYDAQQSLEKTFQQSFELLDELAFHHGLRLLDKAVNQKVRQTRNLWNTSTFGFVSGNESLTEFLASGISLSGKTNVADTIDVLTTAIATGEDTDRFASALFTLKRAYLELDSANEQLWFFSTSALEDLGEEIQSAANRLTDVTVAVSSTLALVLLSLILIALLMSLRFLRTANTNLEAHVSERTRSIQSLLDFSGEGFLSFGADLVIKPEISRECSTIFGRPVAGENLAEVLFTDTGNRDDFTDAMALVFSGTSSPDVVFDLIDSKIRIGERTIELDFQVVDSTTVMCQLQDVTETEKLQRVIESENERRELVLRAVTTKRDFLSILDEAEKLFHSLEACVTDGDFSASAVESETLIRDLHTFKANAAFLRMRNSTDRAHELETILIEHAVLEEPEPLGPSISLLRKAFTNEVSLVVAALGDDWITDEGTLEVNGNTLRSLYDYVRENYPADRTLSTALDTLSRLELGGIFARLIDLTDQLSSSHGKQIRVSVESDDILVTPDLYHRLSDAMNHLVRNMVFHGIEYPRHREKAGKPPEGMIRIEARQLTDELHIVVSDDGSGLSTEKIRAQAIEKGLITEDAHLDSRDIVRFIFEPGFTTSDVITPVSGRGFGLPAVRSAIYGTGGRIGVKTRRGRGTDFTIIVPLGRSES